MTEKETKESDQNPEIAEEPTQDKAVEKNSNSSESDVQVVDEHAENDDETALQDLMKKLDETTAQAKDLREKHLRAVADLDNFRRRVAKEKDEIRRYAIEGLVESLLPTLDNLTLGLKSAHEHHPEAKGVIDGIDMVANQLMLTLRDHGVEQMEPKPGDTFDPDHHECMSHEPHDKMEEGKIISVTRTGYRLKDRLLRPASVIVSSGKEENA